ncbi:SAM-dependent methyltransferase, partial [Escherichia coli]|nr:SAM-dependent methyltransferase [Escherichia coli]
YIDQQTLIKIAHEEGWVVQILFEDENDQYLVRMEPRKQDS